MTFAGLNIAGIDSIELIELLRLHFGMSQDIENRKIAFLRDRQPVLLMEFDKKWKIGSINIIGDVDSIEILEIKK